MIKNWSKFNESRNSFLNKMSESPSINAKIHLLEELSLELTDIGLKVDIKSI